MSGCTGPSGNTSPAATTTGGATTKPGTNTGANAVVNAVQSGNTITISGVKTDQDKDQLSTEFTLVNGTYIVSWDNKDTGIVGDIFTATIDSADGEKSYPISLWDAKGTYYMTITGDDIFTKPGKSKLVVANGGTYTVTLTKPTSGDSAPVTITADKGVQMAKAVKLNAGPVKIAVKHSAWSSDKIGTTSVSLHNAETGKFVSLGGGGWMTSDTDEAEGTIDEAGVYVFGVSFSAYTGGEATVSQ